MIVATKDWSHTCGGGCCFSYGTTLYIDNKEVEDRTFFSHEDALCYVLEELLGVEVVTLKPEHED